MSNIFCKINFRSLFILTALFLSFSNKEIFSKDHNQILITQNKEVSNIKKKIITSKNIGIGKTIKEAKIDAALNAITNVVGTYLDIKKEININSSVDNFSVNRVKNISQNYLEFNRGNVRSIEVISISQKKNLYYVEAIVKVSEENIKDYLDEFSFNNRKIDLDISTIRETNIIQNKKLSSLLDDLLYRKNSTNYKYLKLGKESFLNNFNYQEYCKKNLIYSIDYCKVLNDDFNINDFCWLECEVSDLTMIKKEIEFLKLINNLNNKKDLIIIPFKIIFRKDYIEIYNNIFNSMSFDKKNFENDNLLVLNKNIYNFIDENNSSLNSSNERLILFNDIKNNKMKSYYFKNKEKQNNINQNLFKVINYNSPSLLLEIKDEFGKSKIKTIIFKPHSSFNKNNCEDKLIYLLNRNSDIKCENENIQFLKIFPTLNHFPLNKIVDFSLLNNIDYQSQKLKPIVINSEENFVLILNTKKFEINKNDTIAINFISTEDIYKLTYQNENTKLDFDQRDIKVNNNFEELKVNLKRDGFFNKFLKLLNNE